MAIEWLAGNRLRGTTAERPNLGLPSGSVGGWVELGRSSGATQLDVSSLADKRYYMVLLSEPSGHRAFSYYLNADTGTNYARRYSNNGNTDGTDGSQSSLFGNGLSFGDYNQFMVSYISNLSGKEKLGITHIASGQTTGAANAPSRWEGASKWTNTSNAINRIQTEGTMTDSDSEMVVLGWDPADTHTTNFWEELASVELGSASDTLSSGTITAKKYLWVQLFIKNSGVAQPRLQFNSDDTNTYHYRLSTNGAADTTNQPVTGDGGVVVSSDTTSGHIQFANVFIINNTSNEKLVIAHAVGNNSAGAGNAPYRRETVGKWVNTSNQITQIDAWNNKTGDFDTGSIIKVWGAD